MLRIRARLPAALERIISAASDRPVVAAFADHAAVEIAVRLASRLPITSEAAADIGRRYLDLVVELGKQIDARQAADAELCVLRDAAQERDRG